jgi:hypothetical protein
MPHQTDMTDNDDVGVQDAPSASDDNAGDGLPGWPIAGHPGLRAGAFDHGSGALGIYQVGDHKTN